MSRMTDTMERKMKDSGIPWIGMIPEEWKIAQIKRVVNLVSEKNYNDYLPYVGLENIESQTGKFLTNSSSYEPETNSNKYAKGDILFGKLRPYLAKCVIGESNGRCSSELLVFRSIFLHNKFLHKFLLSPNFINVVNSSTYGTKMPRANWDFISSCQIPVPPLSEQEAIASWLDEKCGEIDELIEVEQKMIEELEAYRQATITETVTRGLNPDAPMRQTATSWIPEIPQHWEICRLKDKFNLSTGTTPKEFEDSNDESFIDWVTPGDISDSGNAIYEASRKLALKIIKTANIELFPAGSILYVAIGASAGKVGYAIIDCYSNQQITALIPKSIISKFFFYYLNSFKNVIRDNAFFTTLPIINNSYLGNILVPIPPLAEQQAIATYLDAKCKEIDELIAVKREKIETLKQYRQSIIFEAVTGKIHVC